MVKEFEIVLKVKAPTNAANLNFPEDIHARELVALMIQDATTYVLKALVRHKAICGSKVNADFVAHLESKLKIYEEMEKSLAV